MSERRQDHDQDYGGERAPRRSETKQFLGPGSLTPALAGRIILATWPQTRSVKCSPAFSTAHALRWW